MTPTISEEDEINIQLCCHAEVPWGEEYGEIAIQHLIAGIHSDEDIPMASAREEAKIRKAMAIVPKSRLEALQLSQSTTMSMGEAAIEEG